MFSFLGKLFGSSKAGDKIIDGVVSAADKLWYTDEEQADDKAKAKTEGFQVYKDWLQSTSGSRLARRVLALIVSGIWAIEHVFSVLFATVGAFASDPVFVTKLTVASKDLAVQASDNNALVGVVLLFYFGGPAAGDAAKGLITRWVTKTGSK